MLLIDGQRLHVQRCQLALEDELPLARTHGGFGDRDVLADVRLVEAHAAGRAQVTLAGERQAVQRRLEIGRGRAGHLHEAAPGDLGDVPGHVRATLQLVAAARGRFIEGQDTVQHPDQVQPVGFIPEAERFGPAIGDLEPVVLHAGAEGGIPRRIPQCLGQPGQPGLDSVGT